MISRFAMWLKPGEFLKFTTGDQEHHLVWMAQYTLPNSKNKRNNLHCTFPASTLLPI
jgi:hypothetical protein